MMMMMMILFADATLVLVNVKGKVRVATTGAWPGCFAAADIILECF